MHRTLRLGVALAVAIGTVLAPGCMPRKKNEESFVVIIETSMGTIEAELWPDEAPGTVKNFLRYVDEEFYDGLIFHRVMPKFMIQCGGFKPDMTQPPTHETIRNEARADVGNERGTLAMARTGAPHSASAQFYINLVNNTGLNKDEAADGFGYCVFGKVTEGMAVVDRIAQVETTTVSTTGGTHENVPKEPVFIKSIRRAE